MNAEEAVVLCRFVKSLVPSQQMDEYTPDAWAMVLADIRFEDARVAAVEVKKREQWIDPSDIIAEVKRIRRRRIDEFGQLPEPPPELDPDNWRAYQKWLVDTERAIGDGELKPVELGGLRERPMKAITHTFKEPK